MESEAITQLESMGFSKAAGEQAISATGSQDIAALLDWLEKHQEQGQAMEVEGEEKKEENATSSKAQGNGESISGYVDQDYAKTLQEMGYSKNVSEKSLFLSPTKSVESALEWINENKDKPDFEEELLIVGREESKSKMTEAEAKQRAKELQQRMRELRKKKEEEDELERERNRIQGGKQLTDQKRVLEEMKIKQIIDQQKRERQQDAEYKAQLLEKLRREKEEKFGKKYAVLGQEIPQEERPKTPLESLQIALEQISIAHPPNLFPDTAMTAFKTIKTYFENIIKTPQEEKYRKIHLSNQNFQKRLGKVFAGLTALDSVGFVEENGFYILHNPNVELLKNSIPLVDKEISKL